MRSNVFSSSIGDKNGIKEKINLEESNEYADDTFDKSEPNSI